jgi:membrane dipeptidase
MDAITVFDGHNDTLLNLHLPDRGEGRSFFERSEQGHIDLPRAREGGFGGGFFACYAPNPEDDGWTEESALKITENGYEVSDAPQLDPNYARSFADELVAGLFRLQSEGGLQIVRTADEIERCLRNGTIAAILHFEGAENLGPDAGALEELHETGLRSLGLVWSRPNAYAHGVPFRFPSSPDTGPGLTGAGKELVRECNRLGVLIDLSHLNERGFWDVTEISEAPLDAIRDSDGMVGVNFAVGFLREDGRDSEDTPLETLVRHVDYLVERVGIERVGFGSDFDGAKVPEEIGDVSGLPKLLAALQGRGYDEAALKKLAHENWVRVLRETWQE